MTQREYPSAPLIGVGAVVFDGEGRVLLVKRGTDPGKGRWSIPGGLVELGETLEAAVVREVAEETGVLAAVGERIEVVERIYLEEGRQEEIGDGDGRGRVRYHYVILDYLCRAVAGELGASSDADEAKWVERRDWDVQDSGPNLFDLDGDLRRVIGKGWIMGAGADV